VRWVLERDGVRLAGVDFGGEGPNVLLLHGLVGDAEEWRPTAEGLTDRAKVVAFDARGHGDSERDPPDVTLEAHVADAAFVIEQRGLAPVTVIGQSYGGLTAFLLAAARPDLVERLVVAEATPDPGDESIVAEFEGVMAQTIAAAIDQDRWHLWERIACPTLVVIGERGDVSRDEAQRMVDALPDARFVEIPGAGHNLHLDRPREWLAALRG
jgi:pimeloyl-ACP methyl ester carboxylesterase